MGRKPNLLIQEFFERGAKLDDQSNRYEHTCKKCGMFFAKGRPDGMNRHLFEKCPNVTDYDKARALACAQGQMDAKKIAQRLGQDLPQPQQSFAQDQIMPFTAPPPPSAPVPIQASTTTLNREPSALDTLAEVAAMPSQEQHAQQDPPQEMDQWMIQLQQQLNEAGQPAHDANAQYQSNVREEEINGSSSQLVQTASAATELQASLDDQTAPGASRAHGESIDREDLRAYQALRAHADGEKRRADNLDPALQDQETTQPAHTTSGDTVTREPDYAFQFPENESTETTNLRGHGLLTRPSKRQRRNKFSTERRKEVGGIRKLGACLRCRMLKKPCSGETPCSTCRAIGSPRLWRTTCVRTRIADEFSLYNTPYFFARGSSALTQLAGKQPMYPTYGRLKVSVATTEIPINFSVVQLGSSPEDGRRDINLDNTSLACKVETEEAVSGVDAHLSSALPILQTFESQPLLMSTISQLASLPADLLVTRILRLHAATTILCAPQELDWHIIYILPSEDGQSEIPHILSPSRPDFAVIQGQTLDAIERFAGQTFKHVANELERRLLARATSTPLTTYLVTVLLLNCVERMSLLFRRFDQRQNIHTDGDANEETQMQNDMAAAGDDWPLSKPPRHYVSQAATFSHLCGMLLRMRQLVPRTVARPDDTLAIVKVQGRRVTEVEPLSTAERELLATLGDGQEDMGKDKDKEKFLKEVAAWLQASDLHGQEVMHKLQLNDDDVGDVWRAWDLRFVGSLVLPEDYGQLEAWDGKQMQPNVMQDVRGQQSTKIQEVRFWNHGEMVDPMLARQVVENLTH
ncbi:Hypothetical protein D9617_35g089980 [Elsinoe fawcettii]|nr:Hypothetical protein D9617_35g089980 [Elsinoe fawcettii]